MQKEISRLPAGRPRSSAVTDRLHAAALHLLEEGPYSGLTVERIALAAGVSRAALYRRYGSVGEVVLGALQSYGQRAVLFPRRRSLPKALEAYLGRVAASIARATPVGKALRGALAQALVDPDFLPGFQAFLEQRRAPLAAYLREALPAAGEREILSLLDALFGPVLYRVLIRNVGCEAPVLRAIVRTALASTKP